MKLTKEMCKAIGAALQSTLDNGLADYSGMVIKVGHATFDQHTVTFKVAVTPGGAESVAAREREEFSWRCRSYGLRDDQYGATFKTPDGREFVLFGIAKRDGKRPILCRMKDGREFCFDAGTVQRLLAAKS